jgi:O-antigen ligase
MIPFVLSHPLGVGTGTMSALSSYKVWGSGNVPFAIQGGLIHNNLLMIAIETGWLGTAMFVWLLFALAISALDNYRNTRDPYLKAVSLALCGFVTFYIGMQVLAPMLMQPLVSYIAFALFALLVIVPDLDGQEPIAAVDRHEPEYAQAM